MSRQPYTERTDKSLVAAYRKGDIAAFDTLVERYRRPVFGFILNSTCNQADAEEVYQETWLKAIRGLDSYKEKNFGGWLVRIARNTMIDRSRRRRPDVSLDAESATGRPLSEVVADGGPGPHDQMVASDLGRAIGEAVDTLQPEQKEVFLMRVEAELSFKEIAAIQGVPINTALSRMQYALNRLKPLLRKQYHDVTDRSE